jgi:3-keto-disaccharide hydrolase
MRRHSSFGGLILALLVVLAVCTVLRAGDDKALKPGQDVPRSKQMFDGTSMSQFVIAGTKDEADWPLEDGAMVSAKHDIESRGKFKSFVLHIEFNEPKLGPEFKSQDRGNSGIFLQGRYELQVLDSYHNDTYAKGGCATIYSIADPTKNAAKPPGEWQTYDITVHAAKFENGKKVKNAHVTVYWNGELVQDDIEIPHETPSGAKETDTPGPIRLQFHNHAVKFRNIWTAALRD